jgi:predicted permease
MPIESIHIRDAFRALRASSMTSVLAILSLALGIGANAALFSLLNGLLLKPLPVREPDRLALLSDGSWTNQIWEQIRDRGGEMFAGAFAWSADRFDLSRGGQTEFVDGLYASGRMFDVLGIAAQRGRLLSAADDAREGAGAAVAVISDAFWKRRYGGASDVIGQTLTLEHVPFEIVGITPAGFFGPDVGRTADVMVPLASERLIRGTESFLDRRSAWWLEIMVRLAPHQSLEQATAALRSLQPGIRDATMPPQYPAPARERYLRNSFTLLSAATGHSDIRSRYRTPLITLMAVAALVLVIACANVANLLLGRATSRRREVSIRLALGSTRWRVASGMLAESLLLAGTGAVAGIALALAASRFLIHQLSTWRTTVSVDVALDWRLVTFAVAVTFVTAIGFGVAPALGLASVSPHDAMREAGRGVAGDRRVGVRGALVAAQIGLSLVLLVAAGLFLRTFVALNQAPLGLSTRDLTIVDMNLQRVQVEPDRRAALISRLRDAAAGVPGVARVSAAMITPLSGRGWNTSIGRGLFESKERLSWMNAVSPGWFDTVGARLIAGRDFAAQDRAGGVRTTIVNQTFARRFLGSGPLVGQTVETGEGDHMTRYDVVGVVTDTTYRSPREGMVPTMFVPIGQTERIPPSMSLIVQTTSGSTSEVLHRVGSTLTGEAPNLAFTLRSFDELVAATMTQERLVAMLSAAFGALAVILAAIGLYGVMSYAVTRQRSDFGVRMALGASPRRILHLVLQRAGLLLGAGLIMGLVLTIWAAGYVRTLLFEVEPRDTATLIAAATLLLTVGFAAAAVPAWRASRIDPAKVLREG